MSRRTKLALVALAVAVVAVGLWFALRASPSEGAVPGPDAGGVRSDAPDVPTLKGVAPPPPPDAPPAEVGDPAAIEEGASVLRGSVLDATSGEPITGARVEVFLVREVHWRTPVAVAHTDAAGRYRLDVSALPGPPPDDGPDKRVAVACSADGYWLEERDLGAPREDRAYGEVDLRLLKVTDVRGRVLAPDGSPAVGAYVRLVAQEPGGRHAYATAGAGGRIEAVVRADSPYVVHAALANVGVAARRTFRPEAGALVDLGDVQLVGPGVVRGVLRYPDGSPASFAKARAWAAEADGASDAEGLLDTKARADREGRFAIRGLAPGSYFAADAAAARSPERGVSEEGAVRCSTGDRDVELEVRGRRLLVFVRDEGDRPVTSGSYSATWRREDRDDDSSAGTMDDPLGLLTFRGVPGETILLSVGSGDLAPAELSVAVRADTWQMEHTLVLRPRSPERGRLRVVLLEDESGAAIEGCTVTLRTPVAEAIVEGVYDDPLSEDGVLPPVPPGTYVLEAHPGRATSHAFPTTCYFPVSREVGVVAGKTTTVRLQPRSGGRLRLTVRGPQAEWPQGPTIVVRVRPSSDPTAAEEGVGAFYTRKPGGWRGGGLLPGRPGVSDRVLEPGSWEVVVRAEGFRDHRERVRVDAGRILDVEVDLEPE